MADSHEHVQAGNVVGSIGESCVRPIPGQTGCETVRDSEYRPLQAVQQ